MSPSSLDMWSSERKKNDVCGLMSRSALPFSVFAGATAKPLEDELAALKAEVVQTTAQWERTVEELDSLD